MSSSGDNYTQLRIIPLTEADPAAVASLFDEQRVEWMSRLRWDYAAPSRILRDLVSRGELLGFGALSGFRLVGFSFYIVETTRCSIGDIYVSPGWRQAGADGKMATAILDTLRRFPRMRRIEFQSPAFENTAADAVFVAAGFQRFDREFMIAGLSGALRIDSTPGQRGTCNRGPEVILRAWQEDDFGPAANVIYQSYKNRIDGKINVLYGSEEGCAELLSILMDNIWCGNFLPDSSLVALDGSTGKHIGLLISSAIATDVGHIGQVSVKPSFQGLGIAQRMMSQAMTLLSHRGCTAVSLVVTRQNTRALRIYETAGFRTIHSFPVYYKQVQ